MLKDTIEAMVGTLSKSVTDINAANPADKDALLTRTFEEFKTAVLAKAEESDAALAELGKGVEGVSENGEPLYKGLGTVGRVANLLGTVADRVKCIQNGVDYMGQLRSDANGGDREDIDVPSEEVLTALDHVVAVMELTLRAAVNEHIDPIDDGDDVEKLAKADFTIINVPSAEDENQVIAVKTMLPESLAKFAADPAALQEESMLIGLDFLAQAGIDAEALSKALGNDGLAKAFPPAASAGATAAAADPAATDDGSQDLPDNSDDDPLMVLGRLLALCMVQLDHIQQMVSGTDDGSGGGDGDDTETGAATPGTTAGTVPAVAKAAPVGALRKLAKSEGDDPEKALMKAEIAELREGVKKLLGAPEAPKAVLLAPALEKGADSTLSTGAGPSNEDLQKVFDALPEDQRLLLLTKAAQKRPIAVP